MSLPVPPDGPDPPLPGPNPLANFTDQALFDAQLVLYLACGRNKAVTHTKYKGHLCYLATLLGLELDNRHLPRQTPPFKA